MIEFDDDVMQFEIMLEGISSAYKGPNKDVDRYRDFKEVFLNSDAGNRVMLEIFTWGHMYDGSIKRGVAVDPYRVCQNEGHREMALQLKRAIMHQPPEPKDKPKKTRKRLKNG
jgi:hypothetical protein